MSIVRPVAGAILVAILAAHVSGQAPQPASPGIDVRFDTVSIKRNTTNARPTASDYVLRPDGGFTQLNRAVIELLNRAFAPVTAGQMVGLPAWASTERYDVRATSLLANATPEQRSAMIRALLADRFELVTHTDSREEAVYELTLARADGRLGSGLTKSDLDCDSILAERAANPPASPQQPDYAAPPPACTLRVVDAPLRDRYGDKQGRLGALLEGEAPLDSLPSALRLGLDRPVVNATGLTGSYRVKMSFRLALGGRGLETTSDAPDAPPSIFTALQEQLGLTLRAVRARRDTLVIDRIERPAED